MTPPETENSTPTDRSSGSSLDHASSGSRDQNSAEYHQRSGEGAKGGGDGNATSVSAHDDTIARDDRQRQASEHAGARQSVQHIPTLGGAGRAVTAANVVIAATGIAAFVITSFQLHSMNGQWSVMVEQLQQMKDANKKTDDAIMAANRQATAAENANKIASEALSFADRPWVHSIISVREPHIKGDFLIADVQIENSGKTPASNLRVAYQMFLEGRFDYQEHNKDVPDYAPSVILYPGKMLEFPVFLDRDVWEAGMSDYVAGKLELHVIVKMTYDDVNKKRHSYYTCAAWSDRQNRFTVCKNSITLAD